MAEVMIHPAAEAEYAAALAWYAARGTRAAHRFASAFADAMDSLARNPELSPLCGDVHRRCQLRKLASGVVYRVGDDRILVVAVPHDRQLPRSWEQRN